METRGFQIPLPISSKRNRPNLIATGAPGRPVKQSASRMISIIIPAHNEEAYLPLTLDALKRQNYPRFEIIVVANGCNDRTAEVARDQCDRLIVLSQKSLGVARNLGA